MAGSGCLAVRAHAARAWGAAYNVGTDEEVTITELAACVRDQLVPDKEIVIDCRNEAARPTRSPYVPSINLARNELGLNVWTPLSEAVRKTARWYEAWRQQKTTIDAEWTISCRDLKKFVIDIDGIIASFVPGNDYALAEPLRDNTKNINFLHDPGHRIALFTARGSETGID